MRIQWHHATLEPRYCGDAAILQVGLSLCFTTWKNTGVAIEWTIDVIWQLLAENKIVLLGSARFPYPTFISSVMHVAFDLQADSLKLKKAPPLPVTHRNPNLAHLQSAPARRVAAAAKRKHREQQSAAVANVIVCLGYRASIFSHAKSIYSQPNMEVWNVAHMEGIGSAKRFKLTLGVGLLSLICLSRINNGTLISLQSSTE
ncbi:hypothetical protein BDR03DRAFT_622372 [Suillus americanus]|nr:hypothetical protein BDR03DRAFT_622372 [Suillus americanus]